MALIEAVFMLPEADNDGTPFTRADWEALGERLAAMADGYSVEIGVHGVWRGYRDLNRRYIVALEHWTDLPPWLDLVRWAQQHFRQQAIYVRVAGVADILESG